MSVPWYLMAKGKGGGGYKTASGPIVSVSDAKAAPLRSLVANIDPVQAGSGDPSPDNVRPISGWSAVNVWRTGKNLLNPSAFAETNIYTVNTDGSITVVLSDGRAWGNVPVIPLKAGTYYATVFGATANSQFRTSDDGYSESSTIIGTNKRTIVLASDGGIKLKANISATYPVTVRILLTTDSSLTEFIPYSGNQYTIQLGDTYYGGTLDVINGVLTVDRAMVDLGTLSYLYRNGLFDATVSGGKLKGYATGEARAISSSYAQKAKTYTQLTDGEMAFGSGYVNGSTCSVLIKNSAYTDATTFKTAMSGVQLVYELATPITIPLTVTQISSLQGQNNVWADSGDVTVEYRVAGGGVDPDLMKLAVAFMGRK